jgi:hypothetical protein
LVHQGVIFDGESGVVDGGYESARALTAGIDSGGASALPPRVS